MGFHMCFWYLIMTESKGSAMTVHISLPPDMEAKLRQRALDVGKDVPTLVREAVEEKLAATSEVMPISNQWEQDFNAWIASHKPVKHWVDDSRDSIYSDRGL